MGSGVGGRVGDGVLAAASVGYAVGARVGGGVAVGAAVGLLEQDLQHADAMVVPSEKLASQGSRAQLEYLRV